MNDSISRKEAIDILKKLPASKGVTGGYFVCDQCGKPALYTSELWS